MCQSIESDVAEDAARGPLARSHVTRGIDTIALLNHLAKNTSGGFLASGRLGYLVTDNVDDILPTLVAAAAQVSEAEKRGERERVERL